MMTARSYLPNRQRTHESGSGRLVQFPPRCIWITRESSSSAWVVLHGNHGWLFGDFRAALGEAHWLSKNCGLPIRRAAG